VIFGLLALVPLIYLIGEVQVGDDWIAVRTTYSKKWTVVRSNEVVRIAEESSLVRKYFGNGAVVEFVDSSGRKAAIPDTWIAKVMAHQILAAFGSIADWPAGLKEKLAGRST